jgi:prepilin-type N-terminal cleavage/methylation domain-containing protein
MNIVKAKKGFTLVELIVVIAVIAILSVFAAVAFIGVQRAARTARIDASAVRVAGYLNHYITTVGNMSGAQARHAAILNTGEDYFDMTIDNQTDSVRFSIFVDENERVLIMGLVTPHPTLNIYVAVPYDGG